MRKPQPVIAGLAMAGAMRLGRSQAPGTEKGRDGFFPRTFTRNAGLGGVPCLCVWFLVRGLFVLFCLFAFSWAAPTAYGGFPG